MRGVVNQITFNQIPCRDAILLGLGSKPVLLSLVKRHLCCPPIHPSSCQVAGTAAAEKLRRPSPQVRPPAHPGRHRGVPRPA